MSPGHDMIAEALKEFGYEAEPEPAERTANGDGRNIDSPYAELNQAALTRLPLWVQELPIHRLRRKQGRYAAYEGVAQWRESTTPGRTLEQRDPNLSIVSSGIKDFGDDRGYTPLDLVMAAKGCDLKEAVDWLDERLGWSTGGPELDIEAIKAK